MPEPSLAYRTVSFSIMTAHDGGSKADANLQVWRPNREYSYYRASTNNIEFSVTVPDGWSYLGQSWSTNNTAPHAVIVCALEPDALVDVASWECVWTDWVREVLELCSLARCTAQRQLCCIRGNIYQNPEEWRVPKTRLGTVEWYQGCQEGFGYKQLDDLGLG